MRFYKALLFYLLLSFAITIISSKVFGNDKVKGSIKDISSNSKSTTKLDEIETVPQETSSDSAAIDVEDNQNSTNSTNESSQIVGRKSSSNSKKKTIKADDANTNKTNTSSEEEKEEEEEGDKDQSESNLILSKNVSSIDELSTSNHSKSQSSDEDLKEDSEVEEKHVKIAYLNDTDSENKNDENVTELIDETPTNITGTESSDDDTDSETDKDTDSETDKKTDSEADDDTDSETDEDENLKKDQLTGNGTIEENVADVQDSANASSKIDSEEEETSTTISPTAEDSDETVNSTTGPLSEVGGRKQVRKQPKTKKKANRSKESSEEENLQTEDATIDSETPEADDDINATAGVNHIQKSSHGLTDAEDISETSSVNQTQSESVDSSEDHSKPTSVDSESISVNVSENKTSDDLEHLKHIEHEQLLAEKKFEHLKSPIDQLQQEMFNQHVSQVKNKLMEKNAGEESPEAAEKLNILNDLLSTTECTDKNLLDHEKTTEKSTTICDPTLESDEDSEDSLHDGWSFPQINGILSDSVKTKSDNIKLSKKMKSQIKPNGGRRKGLNLKKPKSHKTQALGKHSSR